KVFIRDISANQTNLIRFDNAIPVSGPFFVGFKVNFPDNNNDEISDDLFVVPVVNNRPYNGANTMYVQKSNVWYSATELLSFNTSLPIQPVSCLVDIEEVSVDDNAVDVYPNPTTGMLNISFNNITNGEVSLELYDVLGKLVATQQVYGAGDCTIDISAQPEGLYILKVSTADFTSKKKITLTK
ncbi:MAG: T9SS type A sorting domain-containing protein, partial [Bacteroidales bacterium]|nr:T9SS type A sorting domain-containing protein [Bacteroidales bacterium]